MNQTMQFELADLLGKYKKYQETNDEKEKQKISDSMTFSNPIVWMMYKYHAYQGTNHQISTYGDLKKHSLEHDGICSKRFNFLKNYLYESYEFDILDERVFSNDLYLKEFFQDKTIQQLLQNKDFIKQWRHYEFYIENKKVAKWGNYKII
jgi:hypothetical protein